MVEVGCPALHETLADHDLDLPNGFNPGRRFAGQAFVRHSVDAPWTGFGGGEAQSTQIAEATHGLADVRFVRAKGGGPIAFAAHDGELVFGFVLEGSASLAFAGGAKVRPADSFVIPPGEPWRLEDASPDFRLLLVTTARLEIGGGSPL